MQHASPAPHPRPVGAAERSNAAWLAAFDDPALREPALRELYTFLQRGLRRTFAHRDLGGLDLDDLTQDAIVRVLQQTHTFRGDSRFTTWAMAVAVRVALTALRRRRFREVQSSTPMEEQAGPSDAPPPDALVDRRRILARLRTAIGEVLTPRQREAVLGELAGVPSDDLAARLQISRNALYKLHHDARKKLRAALLDGGITLEDVRLELREASNQT